MSPELVSRLDLASLIVKVVIFTLLAVGAYVDYRTKGALRQQIDTQQQIIHSLQSRQEGKI